MVKRGPKEEPTKPRELLRIWNRKNRELSYSDVLKKAEETEKLGKLTKRTIITYLNKLSDEKELEKRVDQNRKTFYRISEKGMKEAIRKKFMFALESMPIDGAVEYDAPFLHLPYIISETTKAAPLKAFQWLNIDFELPSPALAYALYFHKEGKFRKNIERAIGFSARHYLENFVATVLSKLVAIATNKDPNYIENTEELVEWYKDAIDQKMIVMLVFDGKSVAQKADWNDVKKKVKEAKRKSAKFAARERVTDVLLEEVVKHLPKEAKDEQRKLALKYAIEEAIWDISGRHFKSKEEAITTVSAILGNEKLSIKRPIIAPLLTEESKRRQVIEEYLSSPISRHVLKHMEYQYPGTNRVYDIYMFTPKLTKQAS